MERKYKIVIIMITVVTLLFTAITTDNYFTRMFNIPNVDTVIENMYFELKDGYYYSNYGKISIDNWSEIEIENSGYKSIKDFLNTIDDYAIEISNYIGMPDWIDIHKKRYRKDYYFEPVIDFSFNNNGDGLSYAEHYLKLRIKLNIDTFENNFSSIPREMTHIVTGKSASPSLSEGLGFYIQDELGDNVNDINYGIDIFTCSKDYIGNEYILVIDKIGTTNGCANNNDRTPFYILSNSFCRYLIEQHGMDKFMKLYRSNEIEKSYEKIYSKSLDELKKLWIEYIGKYNNYFELSKSYINGNKKNIKLVGAIKDYNEIGGDNKNKDFFVLDKSFKEYLIKMYGESKFNQLIESNYNYNSVYNKKLNELKTSWLEYVKKL